MRSEGFSFNSGGLGVDSCSQLVVVAFATVRRRSQPLTLGEAFGEGDIGRSFFSYEIARKRVEAFHVEVWG